MPKPNPQEKRDNGIGKSLPVSETNTPMPPTKQPKDSNSSKKK